MPFETTQTISRELSKSGKVEAEPQLRFQAAHNSHRFGLELALQFKRVHNYLSLKHQPIVTSMWRKKDSTHKLCNVPHYKTRRLVSYLLFSNSKYVCFSFGQTGVVHQAGR